MGIGKTIKEFRTREGLTQKDLADQLHVTYQAVSRWENDDAEPSIDSLKEMCKILNCSTDELFEIEKDVSGDNKPEEITPVQVIEKVVVQAAKPVLGVCENCNKPIYEASELHRVEEKIFVSAGRGSRTEIQKKILCENCYKKWVENKKQKEKIEKEMKEREFKVRRIHSFIWPSLLAIALLVMAIISFVDGRTNDGIAWLVVSVFGFTFLATMILDNTFIPDLWLEVTSWGFVKLPGVIFELSFDGLIFLIAVKILFFVLGLMLACLAAVFATALAMALSVFTYPFALIKNIKCEE